MEIDRKTGIVMVLFVASVFILASKLMLPTRMNVIIEGNVAVVREIPSIYTILDCIIVAICSFILGFCSLYLLLFAYAEKKEEVAAEGAAIEAAEAAVGKAKEGVLTAVEKAPLRNSKGGCVQESQEAERLAEAEVLNMFKGKERIILETLLKWNGEMNQTELSVRTGIPKSTLSRILRDLEHRGIILRYDYGMSKIVREGEMLRKMREKARSLKACADVTVRREGREGKEDKMCGEDILNHNRSTR
ncbi:MAG: helix-turn-helix domain-containing protein [Candidatus Methanospirare jalkutatii]|nr:helix-turn-helix domain-containing protein [Candidatus Methanospirare jalkutatii]MCW7080645.1 helix-turn-helix domain-containing protein [Candidatus Methanospirare jalkutatii]